MKPEQRKLIRCAIEYGKVLAEKYPEIAELYRQGMKQSEIACRLGIVEHFDGSVSTAEAAVQYALKGHRGGYDVEAYDGLINEEERKILESEHKSESGRARYQNREGVFGWSDEERSELGIRGAGAQSRESKAKGGKVTKQKRAGIYGLSERERSNNAKTGVEARGLVPWQERGRDISVPEKDYAYMLSLLPEFRRTRRCGRGEESYLEKIARVLNEIYHEGEEVRNARAVACVLTQMRKKLA